ncbi:hypothetical protein MKEN_01018100 [Mycena kentingensis (nom. inval.)]|nr:hypothetical protein MKEN_01018100 [Mycena kentingensis (nom. inval.)]
MHHFLLLLAATTTLLFAPVRGATVQWFDGADCTGRLIGTSSNAETVACIFLTESGSVRSVKYADVQKDIKLFQSGGDSDQCAGTPQETKSGDGCSNAPEGFNWQSVAVSKGD